MIQFPQIGTLAAVQYPITYSLDYPRIVCELPGGTTVTSSDATPGRKRWAVELHLLNDEERASLEELFLTCRGRLEPFRWLDPAANLLRYSAELDRAPWESDPGVSLEGAPDPSGGAEAWRIANSSQTYSGLRQRLAVDTDRIYAGSCWVRSASEVSVRVYLGAAGGAGTVERRAETTWRRIVRGNAPEQSQSELEFALTIPPGGQVEIYGPQLECQAAAGGYRRTGDRAGVYVARFNQDYLPFTATGPGEYSTAFEVISIPEA